MSLLTNLILLSPTLFLFSLPIADANRAGCLFMNGARHAPAGMVAVALPYARTCGGLRPRSVAVPAPFIECPPLSPLRFDGRLS